MKAYLKALGFIVLVVGGAVLAALGLFYVLERHPVMFGSALILGFILFMAWLIASEFE